MSTLFLGCATAYDKRGVYHKVRGDETLLKIAKYYHVTVQDLAEWNNIQNPEEVSAGLKLYIPKEGEAHTTKRKRSVKGSFDKQIEFDRSRFSWPVDGYVMSQFGIRNGRRHDGVDIKAKSGTPIVSAAKGKIVFDGKLRGYGNMLIVRHQDRFFTIYAHNSKNVAKKGQEVAKGQLIGYVGSTGRTSGPHLHFEVREGQKARNPLFLLPAKADEKVQVAGVAKHGPDEKNAIPKDIKGVRGKLSKRDKMMEALKSKNRKKDEK